MYKFPGEMRKSYESSPLSFVYYQSIDNKAMPILASDGFCRNTGMKRESVLEWLRRGLFERIHPDDVGIIAQIYIFEQVCKEIIVRHKNGLPLMPVSINFSRQDFDHADIVGEMNRIYDKYEMSQYVDKSYFIVEITEQDIATGEDRLREQLEEIRKNGYRLWLDDFGSGYSAINVFSRFDFDLIKYDMDLLRHLDEHNGVNRVILKELVYLARRLGMHTLIEGLETQEQLSFVKEIGCELAQGFYYHKPEPLEETLFRLENGDTVRECETPDERSAMNKKRFEKQDRS